MSATKVSNFRERIAELISSSGKTQSAIAADFGIAKQTISAWVTGQNSPRTPIVYALSYYFGVSIPWLMGFDVPRNLPEKEYAPLPSDEECILSIYRSLPVKGKDYIQQQVRYAQVLFGEKTPDVSDQNIV